MTISKEQRATSILKGNGASVEFPFGFKVFNAQTDISVFRAESEDSFSEEEVNRNAYSVTLNSDQENNPGGVVVFTEAPANGTVFVIRSSIPNLQGTSLTNHDRFLPEVLNEVHDKLTAMVQQLAYLLGRCLVVPSTLDKTPQEVMSDLMEVSVKATEYAQKAEAIYNEVQSTGLYVSTTWQEIQETKALIDIHKAAIDAALKRSEEILARNEVIGKEVDALVPHLPDLKTNTLHIDEIHRVGSDLRGFETETLDLGSITDTEIDGETRVTEGYIKKVADHIDDCIHPVGDNIEKVENLHNNMEDIQTVATDLQGFSSPTLDLGSITEEAENVPTIEGGYLKTLAAISEDIGALGPKAEDITTVKENLPAVLSTSKNISSVNAVAENMETVTTVKNKLDVIDTVFDNMETVESAASVAENLESIKETVLESNAKAGFSFRYMAQAQGSLTVAQDEIAPSVNIKAGDHVVNAQGDYFEVTEVDAEEQTATLSLKRGSFKGEKGDKGDGLHIQGAFASYDELLEAYPEGTTEGISVGDLYLAGLDLYLYTNTQIVNPDGEVVDSLGWAQLGTIVGPQGETGETPIISVAANQLPAGSSPKVVKTGTNEAPVLTFGIPKGDTGEIGPTPAISIEVQMLSAEAEPSVEKGGTDEAPSFVLKIPRGLTGIQGPVGDMPEVVDLGGLS